MAPAVLAPLMAAPDEPFLRPGAVVLKDSPSSTVIEFDLLVDGVPRRVIYKRFAVTRWSDPWASLFRPPPALRSYVMGHGLRLRGLPTPRPLAVWHRRRFGLACEGYLLTERVPGARELPDHVASLGRLSPAERRAVLGDLIRQAGRLLAVLHDRRLSHRDLKGPNLLVNAVPCTVSSRGVMEGRPTDDGPLSLLQQIWFIDLVGVRRQAVLSPGRRVRNLSRLYASFHGCGTLTRTDLLRLPARLPRLGPARLVRLEGMVGGGRAGVPGQGPPQPAQPAAPGLILPLPFLIGNRMKPSRSAGRYKQDRPSHRRRGFSAPDGDSPCQSRGTGVSSVLPPPDATVVLQRANRGPHEQVCQRRPRPPRPAPSCPSRPDGRRPDADARLPHAQDEPPGSNRDPRGRPDGGRARRTVEVLLPRGAVRVRFRFRGAARPAAVPGAGRDARPRSTRSCNCRRATPRCKCTYSRIAKVTTTS